MALDLYSWMANLQAYGTFDIILPFLLIFTLSYAVLDKTQVLGTRNKNLNVIVSLVLGFFFLQNAFLIASLQNLLPNVSFAIVLGLLFLLLAGVLMGHQDERAGVSLKVASWISVAVLLWALFSRPGFEFTGFQDMLYGFFGTDISSLVLFLLVIIAAIFLVKGGDNDRPAQGGGHPPFPAPPVRI